MKTLNVLLTSREEIRSYWDVALPNAFPNPLYIRCNKEGKVNWEVAPLYTEKELLKKKNYVLHIRGMPLDEGIPLNSIYNCFYSIYVKAINNPKKVIFYSYEGYYK